MIACYDKRSTELFKKAVDELEEVYEGAKFVALSWRDVPCRPKARMRIPAILKESSKANRRESIDLTLV